MTFSTKQIKAFKRLQNNLLHAHDGDLWDHQEHGIWVSNDRSVEALANKGLVMVIVTTRKGELTDDDRRWGASAYALTKRGSDLAQDLFA